MNALTKAFVVVVTILSVVLVALVIPFAARVPDYATQYDQMDQKYRSQLAAADDAANKVRNAIAAKGSELETALESITSLTTELDRAENETKSLATKLSQAQLTVERNSAAMQIAAAESQAKSERLSQQAEQINQYISRVAELQGQGSDLSLALIEERSKVRRLSNNYLRIQEENKALSQQLLEKTALLKTANEQLAIFIEQEGDLPPARVEPPVKILGSVTKIDQVTDGLTFVQLNVGTRDLVKEGMEFTVYRGDEFVGKVQIASVDTADSVGRLTIGGGVQEGDAVRAGGR